MSQFSEALLGLPGITVSSDWPRVARPSVLHRRPMEQGQPQVFALCLPASPEAWVERLMKSCSPGRAARAVRYRHKVDALRCLAAEALLHHAANDVLNLGSEELEIALGTYGKPYFVAHPEAYFNLSHSGEWILCAIHDAPVGVDVEQEKPKQTDTHTFMSPREALLHSQLNREDKPINLFHLWTLKESLLKAAGTGLSHDPRLITISREATGIQVEGAPPTLPGTRWVLEQQPLPGGTAAALCYAGPEH